METPYKIVSESHPRDSAVILMLNGKFGEDALPELQHSISRARDAHQRVIIDLSEVTLVDRKAVKYFSEQVSANVKLINCPSYLRHWIAEVSDENEG